MKLLFVDIETSPAVAYIWRLATEYINPDNIVKPGHTLCWAAKWYGDKNVMFDSIQKSTRRQMIRGIHELMDEADAVCHYNGSKFDLPVLHQEMLQLDMKPPSPVKQIDLLKTARGEFRFLSNKLDYVSQALGLDKKVAHKGMDLWTECMAGDEEAWKTMEKYNKQDVVLLEPLYEKLRPWMKSHPNMALYTNSDKPVCPHCGGSKIQRRGYAHANTLIYPRFQCRTQGCGKWSRGRFNVLDKEQRANILVPQS